MMYNNGQRFSMYSQVMSPVRRPSQFNEEPRLSLVEKVVKRRVPESRSQLQERRQWRIPLEIQDLVDLVERQAYRPGQLSRALNPVYPTVGSQFEGENLERSEARAISRGRLIRTLHSHQICQCGKLQSCYSMRA